MKTLNSILIQKEQKAKANRSNGFTLIELMIGVSVVGVLTAVALPEMTKVLDKGKQSAAESTLQSAARQCAVDLVLETTDYKADNFKIKNKAGTETAPAGTCEKGTTISAEFPDGNTYQSAFTDNTPGKIEKKTS